MSRRSGSGSDITKSRDHEISQSRDLESSHHPAHLLRHRLVSLPVRVVDGREDQILEHLDVVFRDHFGVDFDRLQLLGAVHHDRHHAAAGRGLDAHLGHLLLQALLHLLRLFHHVLKIHRNRYSLLGPRYSELSVVSSHFYLLTSHFSSYISSTSRISAGNTSSIAWTPLSARACCFNAAFRSESGLAALDSGLAAWRSGLIPRDSGLEARGSGLTALLWSAVTVNFRPPA